MRIHLWLVTIGRRGIKDRMSVGGGNRVFQASVEMSPYQRVFPNHPVQKAAAPSCLFSTLLPALCHRGLTEETTSARPRCPPPSGGLGQWQSLAGCWKAGGDEGLSLADRSHLKSYGFIAAARSASGNRSFLARSGLGWCQVPSHSGWPRVTDPP